MDGSLEKDINLEIAKKLKAYLEASDVKVVMTREEDKGLYGEKDSHKKAADMKKRCEVINEAKPNLVVSIHQNSYTSPEIKGAQVFYYTTSSESQKLAEILQNTLIEQVDPQNHRAAKSNDSYYLLKKAVCPIVIVECGFLSNWNEAALLVTEDYQQKIAQAIADGIEKHLSLK